MLIDLCLVILLLRSELAVIDKIFNVQTTQMPQEHLYGKRPSFNGKSSQIGVNIASAKQSSLGKNKKAGNDSQSVQKPLPHRYKTEMCKNWAAGKTCTFGKNCNYAHGQGQLKKFLALQAQVEGEKVTMQPERSRSSEEVESDKIDAKKPIEREEVKVEGKPEWVAQFVRMSNAVRPTKSNEINDELVVSKNEDFPKISDKEDDASNSKDDNYDGSVCSNLSTQRGTDQEGEKFSDSEADYGLMQLNIEEEEERGSVVVVSNFNDTSEQPVDKIKFEVHQQQFTNYSSGPIY